MEMSVIGAKNVANMIIEKYGISNEKNSNIHSRSELWLVITYPSIWIKIKYVFIKKFQKITENYSAPKSPFNPHFSFSYVFKQYVVRLKLVES